MTTFYPHNWIDILRRIHSAKHDKSSLPSAHTEEFMNAFAKAYDVNIAQVNILAFLAEESPRAVVEDVLISIVSGDMSHAGKNLQDLMDRNFIDKFKHIDDKTYYMFNTQAYEALSKDKPYGENFFKDVIKELWTVEWDGSDITSWIIKMSDSIAIQKDSSMKDGLYYLNVESMPYISQKAFWILVSHFVKHFTSPLAFCGNHFSSGEYTIDAIELKIGLGDLVKSGLACSLPIEPSEDTHETDRYVIAPKVVEALFHGKDELIRYDELSRQANIILSKDIVEKELFFAQDSQREVDNLKRVLSKDGFTRAQSILKRQKRNPAVQSLFYGPPGTGKTEVIKQLARESGRDLIIFDAAKVIASAWGAAEKNLRSLFLSYDYITAISSNAPILMFNEADAVLSKRLTNIDRAIDKGENNLSNILLQAFEDMSGILLATTNLASNMDDAFDRRFLFKTRLDRPDVTARKKIWKSLVADLSDSEAAALAEKFDMSGGQISNVVAKRNLAELYYEGDRGLSYITNLCKNELMQPINGSESRRIGF